jgi:hypothetical protein
LAQPATPQRANKKPYLHGKDAPRHYPHTLIENPILKFKFPALKTVVEILTMAKATTLD